MIGDRFEVGEIKIMVGLSALVDVSMHAYSVVVDNYDSLVKVVTNPKGLENEVTKLMRTMDSVHKEYDASDANFSVNRYNAFIFSKMFRDKPISDWLPSLYKDTGFNNNIIWNDVRYSLFGVIAYSKLKSKLRSLCLGNSNFEIIMMLDECDDHESIMVNLSNISDKYCVVGKWKPNENMKYMVFSEDLNLINSLVDYDNIISLNYCGTSNEEKSKKIHTINVW